MNEDEAVCELLEEKSSHDILLYVVESIVS